MRAHVKERLLDTLPSRYKGRQAKSGEGRRYENCLVGL